MQQLSKWVVVGILALIPVLVGCVGTSDGQRPEQKDAVIGRLILWLNEFQALHSDPVAGALSEEQQQSAQELYDSINLLASSNFTMLARLARSGKDEERNVALAALGFTQRKDAVPILTRALNENSEYVLTPSLVGLGFLGYADTPVDRIVALCNHRSTDIRVNALFALGKILVPGEPRGALPIVLKSLEDRNALVRYQACEVLGRLAIPETGDALAGLLTSDNNFRVRMKAAAAMAPLLEDQFLEPMIESLKDTNTYVVRTAAEVLRQYTGKDFGAAYATWNHWLLEKRSSEQLERERMELEGEGSMSEEAPAEVKPIEEKKD